MYPGPGGSSSFAPHAFNEFWSFFAAWGQMLNYVITIAISAFFVPHRPRGRSSRKRAMDARAIVMPLAPNGGPSPFGHALETVLRERPAE